MSSGDTTVNEGDALTLGCQAEGYPQPEISWRREDGGKITLRSSKSREGAKSKTMRALSELI